MAKGRILKKQISLSEQVNSLSLKATLLYTWTLSHADDFGRLPGSPRRLKAQVVPLRDDFSTNDVADCLRELHDAGLIIWYEVAGDHFLQFPTWDEHQSGLHKRTASKYPEPPEASRTRFPEIPGTSGNFPASRARGTEQNGTEQEQNSIPPSPLSGGERDDGTIEPEPAEEKASRRKANDYTLEFDDFWLTYPRRVAKKAAFDKWRARLRGGVTATELITAAQHYAIACQGREERYIMQPQTFLGPNDRWRDFLQPPTPADTKARSPTNQRPTAHPIDEYDWSKFDAEDG